MLTLHSSLFTLHLNEPCLALFFRADRGGKPILLRFAGTFVALSFGAARGPSRAGRCCVSTYRPALGWCAQPQAARWNSFLQYTVFIAQGGRGSYIVYYCIFYYYIYILYI